MTLGRLTTHVLDTANGRPAAGVRVRLYALEGPDGNTRRLLRDVMTNAEGRCDEPLIEGEHFLTGRYEVVFGAGAYFASIGAIQEQPAFVDDVVLRFGIANAAQHYHVPLLVSPWSYSTYRGS